MLSVLFSGLHRGTATAAFSQDDELSPDTLGFSENFDGVSAPALPVNWTTTGTGMITSFVTSTTLSDTAPNAAFVNDPSTTAEGELVTPSINIGQTGSKLLFRHNYNTEVGWDGGVVEISISGGPFQDIITAGGTFVSGAYPRALNTSANPLSARQAWTGTSGGFITTEINIPATASGHNVRFKWRMGSDASVAGVGWYVDTIAVTNTITAENTASITIPDSGTATSYPSNVTVTGLPGAVASVAVVLNTFTHTAPDDVDLLLVSPTGRKVVLMSDAGGANPITNLSLVFDDTAAAALPDSGTLTSGTFKPTDFEPGDMFPAPAPSGALTGTTLSAFNGMSANGVWGLYLVDDNGNNAGSISGGWGLLIATSTTVCPLNLSSVLQAFPVTGGTGSFDINSPNGCDWSAVSLSSFVTITSSTSGSGGNASITFNVDPNMGAGRTGTIRITNAGVTRTFTIQQPSGCPFSLNQETQNFSGAGGAGSVQVTAAGVCGWTATTKDNWITITSGAGSGNGTVSFTVSPNNSGSERTGTITIGARTLTIVQAKRNNAPFDFDGDGKADLSVFRPGAATWYISNSSNGTTSGQQFGLSTDKLTPADYDGDGKADLAVFRNGAWYILQSSNGSLRSDQWGVSGDVAVPADYDGDGKADLAVWRSSNGSWYIYRSSDAVIRSDQFGIGGDKPVIGDYDGDNRADLAVFRPGTGTWYILRSSDGAVQSTPFGLSTDTLAQADYDGDARTDIATYRSSSGAWYVQQSSAGFTSYQFGLSTDAPAPADYDGDGKADITVFRQGNWYILQSTNGATRSEQWGANGDVPVPSSLIAP